MRSREHPLGSDRAFGVVMAVAIVVFSLAPMRHGAAPRMWPLPLGALCAVLAVVRPLTLRPLNIVWRRFGEWLGRYVSPPLLAVLYLVTFVPTAMILRALRKDPLRRAFQPSAASYWIERDPAAHASMRDQF